MSSMKWRLFSFLALAAALGAQTPPSTVVATRLFNLGDASVAANVIDNRSTTLRRNNNHAYCATGTGSWTVVVQYSDTSATGPWTAFGGSAATVTNASANCVGFGFGYHDYISFSVTGSATVSYSGSKDFFMPTIIGTAVAFPVTVPQGGTALTTLTSNGVLVGAGASPVTVTAAGTANQVFRVPGAGGTPAFGAIDLAQAAATTNALLLSRGGLGADNSTAVAGRFPRHDGTNYVPSLVAAAGAGTCTNQFVRATVDNAVPTCAAVAGTDFANQSANVIFAGPASGGAASPTFRAMVKADTPATTVHTDQLNTYTAGMKQLFQASATTAGARIAAAALPSSPVTGDLAIDSGDSNKLKFYNGTAWSSTGGTGTVTSVAITPTAEFTVSGSPITTSGTITFSKATQSANTFWAGPTSGGAAAPAFRTAVKADLPAVTLYSDAGAIISTGSWDFSAATAIKPAKTGAADPATCSVAEFFVNTSSNTLKLCTATNVWTGYNNGLITITNEGTTGTTLNKLVKLTGDPARGIVTTAGDTGGAIGVCIAGCGITGSAQIRVVGQASCVFDGATTARNYVKISSSVAGDCMDAGATYPATGQVVGRVETTNGGGGTYTLELFSSEVQASVRSVALVMPAEFSVAGSPVTGTGTFTVTKANQSANLVYAGPSSGGAAAPTFRTLVKADQVNTTMYTDQANTITGGLLTLNLGTTPSEVLRFDIAQPSVAGTRNSHWFVMRGTSFDASGHNADWLAQVQPTSNAGVSTLVIQNRIDAGGFANRITITDAGTVSATIFDASTGYRIGGAAASGNYLRGNGTNFVSSAILSADLPATVMRTDQANIVTTAGGVTMDNQLGIRLREATGDGTNYAELRAGTPMAGNITWTLPAADAAGFFRSNGSGAISLNAASGTGSCTNQFARTLNDNAGPTCATVAKADAVSTFVHTDQANTYTAGMKQTFQNSATTAGANLASSADPSTPAQGDIWINTSDLKWRGAAATQTAIRDPGGNGILSRTALGATSAVTITAGSGISVTNGDGTGGNPTIAARSGRWAAFCSGTASSSATLFATIWDSTACTNTTEGVTSELLVPAAGTLRNLRAKAGTAGFAAGSGAITLRVNGVNSAATCTIGTGTTCSDAVNTAALAAGDRVTIQIVTQATETLANVQVSFEW